MEILGDTANVTIGPSLDCPTCGQHFTAPIRRQQHMTFHRPRNLMCYCCKNPEVQFPCHSAMVQHMMTGCGNVDSHELDWLISCWYQWNRVMIPEMRTKIRQRKDLAPAANILFHEKLGKWYCSLCKKMFKLEKGAQMHVASNIHNPNIYRCPACKGEFPSFGALLLHAESLKCSLIIKKDSTLAKLLHFLHLKLTPASVEDVIKEDLGVLISKVTPPVGSPAPKRAEKLEEKPAEKLEEKPAEKLEEKPAEKLEEKPAENPAEKPASELPVPDLPDLIDLTDLGEVITITKNGPVEGEEVKETKSLTSSMESLTLTADSKSDSDTSKSIV